MENATANFPYNKGQHLPEHLSAYSECAARYNAMQ